MGRHYYNAKLPDPGLLLKRGERSADGTWEYVVYQVRVDPVTSIKGTWRGGRMVYRAFDKEFSCADEAARYAAEVECNCRTQGGELWRSR